MILFILAFLLILSVVIRILLKNRNLKPKTSDLKRQEYMKQLNLLDRWDAEAYDGITKEKIQQQQDQLYAFINELMEPTHLLNESYSQAIDAFILEVKHYESDKNQRIQILEKQEKCYTEGLEKSRSFFERVKVFPVEFVYTANDLEKKLLDLRVVKHSDPFQLIPDEEIKKFEQLFSQMDELDAIYTELTSLLADFEVLKKKKKLPTKTIHTFKEQQEKIYSAIHAGTLATAKEWLEKSKVILISLKKQSEE
jgi:hypothetical protein